MSTSKRYAPEVRHRPVCRECRRLLEPIGNMPPAEREALYYEQQGQAKMVA